MSNNYCLIMAGGSGTRFWPRSRVKKPKQYLSLFGERSLIQESVQRFANFIPEEGIYVVSAKSQQAILEEQTPNLPRKPYFRTGWQEYTTRHWIGSLVHC